MNTVLKTIKKNRMLSLVFLLYLVLFVLSPAKASLSVQNSLYYLVEMLQVLPVIFLLTVVIEAWIPKEAIIRHMGDKSGLRGNILSLALGSLSAGPIYAAFPISKALLGKGASITNIVIILSAWAVIKVPMLANEAKFLGLGFMAVRWVLTVAAILLMAVVMGKLVKGKDMPALHADTHESLTVNPEYCVGCGVCVKMMPETFEMKDSKAVVKSEPGSGDPIDAILLTVQKCPTKAIVYSPGESHEQKQD